MIQYDAPALNPFAVLNYALEKCGKTGRPIVQSAIWRLWLDDSFGAPKVRPSTVENWWSPPGDDCGCRNCRSKVKTKEKQHV